MTKDEFFMQKALMQAQVAAKEDEVPVGAVIVKEGRVIARAHNKRQSSQVATHHAEILAIERACKKVGFWRLEGCELYVTLEPCPMCAGAAVNARIDRIIFGATDPKAGYCGSLHNTPNDERLNHRPVITGGVLGEACAKILTEYFRNKRKQR